MPEATNQGERVFRGIPVSAGVSRGKILVLGTTSGGIPHRKVGEEELVQEVRRLEEALVETRQQILEVQRQVSEGMGSDDASIFDAHLLVLEDETLIEEVTRLIHQKKVNVEYAFHQVSERYAAALSAIEDEYLRERAADMRDVTSRILSNLLGNDGALNLNELKEPRIIVSHDLAPSMTAGFNNQMVLGMGTDVGSKTSHTAILARSLQIPAVVGLGDISLQLVNGQNALLDGYNGLIILNPSDQTLFEYGQLALKRVNLQEKLRDLKETASVTLDGTRIILSANIEQASDTAAVLEAGAEGVGLFRTEFLFVGRHHLPSEEEQYDAYRQVAAGVKPHPLVIRTLDLGGDKLLTSGNVPQEMNPFLGWRAIRYCLEEKDLFRSQLRAILRASVEGNVKVMFPMISGLSELNQALSLLDDYKEELRKEQVPFDPRMEVGIMIEIPSAAMVADALAKRVQFFSIGTNDLIQYALAVDRLNEKIAHLYEPTHPSILRLIKMTVSAGQQHHIWTGVCGEMAGEPPLVPLLIGLGVNELSVTSSMVPSVKFLIRRLKISEAKELADFALQCESGAEILQRCQTLARRVAPGLFETGAKVE